MGLGAEVLVGIASTNRAERPHLQLQAQLYEAGARS